MIQLTPHMRIFMAREAVDFRKGIDGLAAVVRDIFERDPFSGHLFVFHNKGRTSFKILVYDGNGFWLMLSMRLTYRRQSKRPGAKKNEKYAPSARSTLALLTYGAGFPFYRLETLQRMVGVPFPTSTQWDVVVSPAEQIYPVFLALYGHAA